jgi:cellobiose phosphorylase
MYRLLVETLLGANLEGDNLRLAPRIPKSWPSYKIHYRYRQTVYHITFTRIAAPAATKQLVIDGQEVSGETIHLVDDHQEHSVEMTVPDGPASTKAQTGSGKKTKNLCVGSTQSTG